MKNFKKVISTVIALAISASTFASASKFSDVADTASYAEAIEVLSALGIVNGYVEDGVTSFKPEGEITRAEAATMIVGALNMTEDAKNSAGSTQFADVNEKASWATGYVNVGVSEGFIAGRSATEFDPQANVTYAEMCVMLTKITGYADYAESSKKDGDPWYKCYTDMAANMGLNKGASVPLTSNLTRGTVAQMIYNAITTPVLGVDVYAFKGNEYKPQDGATNFKTVLSDKFDGYVLTVRISQTAKANGLENDEAYFKAVKADYWNGQVKEYINKTAEYPVILTNGVDVSDYLNQTGKAVIIINEFDENEMIYFKADARLEKKIVAAEDYVRQGDRGTAKDFYTLAENNKSIKFGSTELKVTPDVALYVNGKEFVVGGGYTTTSVDHDGDPLTPPVVTTTYASTTNINDILDKFFGNAQGDITFVKSVEGAAKYDSIFVNHYEIGKVTSVSYKNEKTSVRVTPIDDTTVGAVTLTGIVTIEIEDEAVEEGDVAITVKKNGAEVELKELVKDDIIAFSTDIPLTSYNAGSLTLSNPQFIDVLASDEAVKGMVVDYDDEVGTFTVGETDYGYVGFNYSSPTSQLSVTHTYELLLDPFGRIAESEKVGTTDKFAILEKYSSGRATLVLADGSRATYEVDYTTDFANDAAINALLPATSSNIDTRVVKYRVSNDEVKLYAVPSATKSTLTNAKYNPSLGKVGSVKVEDGVNFVDASKYTGNVSEYAKFDTSNFVAQTGYTGYAFKISTSDPFYSFVIFTSIGVTFTEESRFAVLLENVGPKMTKSGEAVYGAKVLYNGVEDILYWENAQPSLVQGDAIFFTIDSEGLVDISTQVEIYTKAAAFTGPSWSDGSDYIAADWTIGSFNSPDTDIRLVSGVVTDVTSNSITFGVADSNNEINFANVETDIIGDVSGLFTYGIADECQAYEYDSQANISSESKKYRVTDAAAIIESNMIETSTDVYSVTDPGSIVTNAVALVVNGDVVCIYAIY